jgi:hypothetical protein
VAQFGSESVVSHASCKCGLCLLLLLNFFGFAFSFHPQNVQCDCAKKAISWLESMQKPEVTVLGRRQGVTAKTRNPESFLCRAALASEALRVAAGCGLPSQDCSYANLKKMCAAYSQARQSLLGPGGTFEEWGGNSADTEDFTVQTKLGK